MESYSRCLLYTAGMDAAAGAYAMGAESVTCIDVQKPAAFAHEIAHIEALGGKLLWPVMTKEITDGGLITADGTLISGDMVIITIGESPALGYLPEGCLLYTSRLVARGNVRKEEWGRRFDERMDITCLLSTSQSDDGGRVP